ncbi:hypothetical protein JCGZ_04529 [Jatropha curcas]|uniref:Uncharacterized protein n=1 Tax=Jatropha curcas TaxID=180498 RepID=A0A067LNZ2_JATCU|nr:hypothetical protein JCGZ_04529 [Jatropha curcas]
MWHIVEKKPLNLCHIIFDKMQNNPKKLPYGMILTPVFEFLDVDLRESDGFIVSKLDSGSLKMKDEEGEEEKEKEEKGKEEAEKVKKEKEKVEKEKERREEAEKKKKREDKGKEKLGETEKEEKRDEAAEEEKLEEEAGEKENKLEKERKEETEKEKTAKKEAEEEIEEKKEPGKVEKGMKVEEVSDAETEKLEISDEERSTEVKTEKESEMLSAQRSREAMLGRMERELIEEHNKELDEAIKHCKTVIGQNQSLIETLERMKDVNERKLATLKVKGTPYTPTSEKPKRVKHTAGKHRTHGRKPPLHPSSKWPESSSETAPA